MTAFNRVNLFIAFVVCLTLHLPSNAETRSRLGNPPSYEINGKRYQVMHHAQGYRERGIASWYGPKFHRRLTSSGEVYDMYKMTAAHPSLPLPTYVRVTNLENHRSITVKVNDRGPFHDDRLIDLSYAAAKKLGVIGPGTSLVEVEALPTTTSTTTRKHPRIYLQVGAFSSKQYAKHLMARVKSLINHPVQLEHDARDRLFRVQVGPLPNFDLANLLHNRIQAAGFGDPIAAIR